ncbi:hypothetical protein ACHAWF_018344 [Thalassiosira exigua]
MPCDAASQLIHNRTEPTALRDFMAIGVPIDISALPQLLTMGLLKHAVLPFFAVLNLALVFKCLVAEDIADLAEPLGRDSIDALPMTPLERHLFHCLGGTFVVFFVNNVAAIFVENSHYRGMAVLLQVLFFVVDAYSYVKMGLDIPTALFLPVGVGLVGLAVHSMEPGLFTKDKGAEGKSKNS